MENFDTGLTWKVETPEGTVIVSEECEVITELQPNGEWLDRPERRFRMTAVSNMGWQYGYAQQHVLDEPTSEDCRRFASHSI